ncbi:uncharacterized protein LACBIDRAFT_295303 [Laccaria bicolor S238N-H82]|uniref:Predicted protein n=1 Tax=Laccaria bicolor (strain S238N-H82 / ATCC MYA-4686) TaxID=486041 RepID=B0DQ91_LACBS|nr:uncharacterized protein LACBIDRAFT_295303 [Laccaria bicolor S238N-H82]EDR03254.1 predicted protein [Laccaria bicolor S238N-H82]|eukprot:XP_001886050.1 predicted protein [Laccaria bicolor S238N-H82]
MGECTSSEFTPLSTSPRFPLLQQTFPLCSACPLREDWNRPPKSIFGLPPGNPLEATLHMTEETLLAQVDRHCRPPDHERKPQLESRDNGYFSLGPGFITPTQAPLRRLSKDHHDAATRIPSWIDSRRRFRYGSIHLTNSPPYLVSNFCQWPQADLSHTSIASSAAPTLWLFGHSPLPKLAQCSKLLGYFTPDYVSLHTCIPPNGPNLCLDSAFTPRRLYVIRVHPHVTVYRYPFHSLKTARRPSRGIRPTTFAGVNHELVASAKVPRCRTRICSFSVPSAAPPAQTPASRSASFKPAVPQYLTAEQEKAALRRYEEAKRAVDRTQGGFMSDDGHGSRSTLFPMIRCILLPLPGLPPKAILSEKERMRRVYESQDAAALRNNVNMESPLNTDYADATAQKEALRRKFEARDALSRENSANVQPQTPPCSNSTTGQVRSPARTRSASSTGGPRPTPVPPTAGGSGRVLSATEEKAMLKARYEAMEAPQPLRMNGSTLSPLNGRQANASVSPSPSSSVPGRVGESPAPPLRKLPHP